LPAIFACPEKNHIVTIEVHNETTWIFSTVPVHSNKLAISWEHFQVIRRRLREAGYTDQKRHEGYATDMTAGLDNDDTGQELFQRLCQLDGEARS
jgi:hypothetical protein